MYVWRREPSARLNRAFAVLCACFAYWAFLFTFIYAAPSKPWAWLLYRIAAPGWCLLPGVALYFVLVASRSRTVRSPWSIVWFLAPGTVFSIQAARGILIIQDLEWSSLGWHEVSAPHSPWFVPYVLYAVGGIVAGIVQLARWRRRAGSSRERRQVSTILTGWSAGAVLMFVPNILLPAVGLRLVPAIGPIVSLAFPFAIWRAIERYRLMTLTASFAADAIVEKIADMTLLISPEGRMMLANPAVGRMLGYSAAGLIGQRADVLFANSSEATALFRQLTTSTGASLRREVDWRTASGETIPADTSAAAIADRSGELLGVVVVGHDLRPTRQLERELRDRERVAEEWRRAKIAAEEASLAKSTFLANMSHELRTPLNAIIGYSELLHEDALEAGAHRFLPDLERIDVAARHLLSMVSDILDLAKIEAGKLDVSHASFDLRATVADALTTVQPIAAKNRNALSAQVDDGLPAIVSDEVKVRQILVNLLSNACKFTEAGTVELRVVRDPELSAVRISVTDTGIGMTPQELERVFLPFTQGDGSSTRRFGGTGLGLTITSRLCERLGAQIAVSSVPGRGSTFEVRLPITPG